MKMECSHLGETGEEVLLKLLLLAATEARRHFDLALIVFRQLLAVFSHLHFTVYIEFTKQVRIE